MIRSFIRRLRLFSAIAQFRGVVRESFHCLFELDVRLGSRKDFAHLGDIVLQEVFMKGMSDLQPTDECECRYFLPLVSSGRN